MSLRRLLILASLFITTSTAAQASCLCLKCAFGGHEMFRISSSAMLPTLPIGACPIATHYGTTLMPERGQMIVFKDTRSQSAFVFRLIGLAGDRIALEDGVVILNGAPLPQEADEIFLISEENAAHYARSVCGGQASCEVPLLRETLPDGTSYQLLEAGESRFDTMAEVTVPKGHVFVLGDSRNNAADSRLPQDIGGRGFVPVENLIGVFEAN